MSNAIQSIHRRLEEVIAQTVSTFQAGIEAGTISEAAAEKVNHLLNTFDLYRREVNERLAEGSADTEPATMPAFITVTAPPVTVNVAAGGEPGAMPPASLPILELTSGNYLNLACVAWLDVASKTLILSGGAMRSLDEPDLNRIKYYLKHQRINESKQ